MSATVDLARARRLRDNLAELRALVRGPTVAARTRGVLDLAALLNPTEGEMAHDKPVTTRLPEDVIARLDRLADRMAEDPTLNALAGGKLNRSQVLRIAVTRGIAVLESEHSDTDTDE